MIKRRNSAIVTLILALGLLLSWPGLQGVAEARDAGKRAPGARDARAQGKQGSQARRSQKSNRSDRRKRARRAQARKKKVCTRRNGKRRCRWVARFDGHGVSASKLRDAPLPKPSGEIWLYAVNFREEVKVNIFNESGELDQEALAQLDAIFRCRRTGEERAVDPRLYEVLSTVYEHFGKQRIELVSGFRNQPNQGSRHFHASAMDIKIPGVSTRKLYEYATSLDAGGMGIGIYPTSGFVHIDWRAPGEKSYRWTDYSGPGGDKKPRRRNSRKQRPNS